MTGRTFLSASTSKRMPSQILSMRRSSMSWIRYKPKKPNIFPELDSSLSSWGEVAVVLAYLVYNGDQRVVVLVLVLVKLV